MDGCLASRKCECTSSNFQLTTSNIRIWSFTQHAPNQASRWLHTEDKVKGIHLYANKTEKLFKQMQISKSGAHQIFIFWGITKRSLQKLLHLPTDRANKQAWSNLHHTKYYGCVNKCRRIWLQTVLMLVYLGKNKSPLTKFSNQTTAFFSENGWLRLVFSNLQIWCYCLLTGPVKGTIKALLEANTLKLIY